MEPKKFNSKSIIQKFRKQFFVGGGIALIVILILTYSTAPRETVETPKDTVDTTFSGVKNQTPNPAEVMQQHLNTFELNQQKVNQQNAERIAQLESENQAYKQAADEAESKAVATNQKLAQLNTLKSEASGVKAQVKPQKMIMEDDLNDGIATQSLESSSTNVNSQQPADDNKNIATYIPSNSFIRGVLISALSANTGGNANTSPTPVLIRLTDLAQLPNSFKANIKSCMVGGAGWGDLSTERVKIRLTKLSCVLKSGQAIDIDAYGYISGEDSKAGIKGMVVTHSGSVAAKAALAGFIQGLGVVGQAVGQTQTITPLGGVTTTISPDQAIYAGVGTGLSQVGSTLSQYYMSMLQQISPAIEVSAGRHITVVFEKGIEFKLPINDELSVGSQPLPFNRD